MARSGSTDVVVVGGGIAGAALALVLARHGVNVAVLERQTEYDDRVRGESMHAWGVAETQRLGITDVLLRAGGVFVTRMIIYDELISPAVAEQAARDLGGTLPDVPGPLCAGHPASCRALSRTGGRRAPFTLLRPLTQSGRSRTPGWSGDPRRSRAGAGLGLHRRVPRRRARVNAVRCTVDNLQRRRYRVRSL